jgi:hypothetical protein
MEMILGTASEAWPDICSRASIPRAVSAGTKAVAGGVRFGICIDARPEILDQIAD